MPQKSTFWTFLIFCQIKGFQAYLCASWLALCTLKLAHLPHLRFFLLTRIYQAQWLSKFINSLVCPPQLLCSMQQETENVPSIQWVRIPCSIKNSFGAEARVTKDIRDVVVCYQRCIYTGVHPQPTRPSRRCQRAPNHSFNLNILPRRRSGSRKDVGAGRGSAIQGDNVSAKCDTQAQKWYKSMHTTCYQICIHTGVILQATRPSRRRQRASSHPSN